MDITKGPDCIFKQFSGKVRNQICKAQKSGLKTQIGGAELLEEFYEVFAANMRDLGSPVHHPTFFSSIFEEFGIKTRLLIVRENKKPVGGMVCVLFKDTLVVPWHHLSELIFPSVQIISSIGMQFSMHVIRALNHLILAARPLDLEPIISKCNGVPSRSN